MDKFNIKRLEGYTTMFNHHLRALNLSYSADVFEVSLYIPVKTENYQTAKNRASIIGTQKISHK